MGAIRWASRHNRVGRQVGELLMLNVGNAENEENNFGEFRRKVRSAEVLSAAMERPLRSLHFTGRLSIVVQNGRVLKSGYEEGYFHQHAPL